VGDVSKREPIGICDLCGDLVDESQGRESGIGLVFCYRCVTREDEARARLSVAIDQIIEQEGK